jgi:Zn-dependent peptidase ImmA (M78 family)
MDKIIGTRLRKARQETGLSQGAFARAVGLSSEFISLLEAGKRTPSLDTLNKISSFLNKDTSFFFQVREPAFTVLLRGDSLDDAARVVLRKFQRYCERYLNLEEETGRRLELAPLYANISPERMADEERRRLGLGEEPIRDVFALCELNGCRILRAPIHEASKLSGVFVFMEDRNAAFALVNSAQTLGRQVFTAAHEYCHYLRDRLDSPVVDNADMFVDEYVSLYAPREQFAQAFAARFLMPPSKVRATAEKEIGSTRLTYDDVIFLKRYFGVSVQAMLRTLRNIGMLRSERFEEYWKRDAEAHERELFGKSGAADKAAAIKPGFKPGDATQHALAFANKAAGGKPVPSDRYRLLYQEAERRKNAPPHKDGPKEEMLELPLAEEEIDTESINAPSGRPGWMKRP